MLLVHFIKIRVKITKHIAVQASIKRRNTIKSAPHIDSYYLNISLVFLFVDGGQRKAHINALLYMIAVDKEPLSMPERRGFQLFVKTLCPLYELPCAATVTTMMEGKYESLKRATKSILAAHSGLAISTDLWTETMTMRTYFGLTAHYRDGRYSSSQF